MDSNVTSTIRRPSLLSVRRPPPHTEDSDIEGGGNSSEDGTNFRKSLQIDMKGLVGDAVGNVRCFALSFPPPTLTAGAVKLGGEDGFSSILTSI